MIEPIDLFATPSQTAPSAKADIDELFQGLLQALFNKAGDHDLGDLIEGENSPDREKEKTSSSSIANGNPPPFILPHFLPLLSITDKAETVQEGNSSAAVKAEENHAPFNVLPGTNPTPPALQPDPTADGSADIKSAPPNIVTPQLLKEAPRISPAVPPADAASPSSAPPLFGAPAPNQHRVNFTDHLKNSLHGAPPPPVEQVAIHLRRAVAEKTDTIEIKLTPPDLGKLTIHLSIDEDKQVTAIISAEKNQTLDLLHRDHRHLEQVLNASGLKTEDGSIQFELASQQQQRQQPDQPPLPDDLSSAETEKNAENIPAPPSPTSDNLIDLAI